MAPLSHCDTQTGGYGSLGYSMKDMNAETGRRSRSLYNAAAVATCFTVGDSNLSTNPVSLTFHLEMNVYIKHSARTLNLILTPLLTEIIS